jgi:hypothetical protein
MAEYCPTVLFHFGRLYCVITPLLLVRVVLQAEESATFTTMSCFFLMMIQKPRESARLRWTKAEAETIGEPVVQPDDLRVRTHIWWRRGCKLCLRDVSALYTHIGRMLILQWSVPAPVRIVLPASYSSFENAKLFASLETSFEQAL